MALINIEYGSLASSETMNNNFSYLDDRISDSNTAVNTSISSILSNIATINTRLNELSSDVEDELDELDTKVEGYKTKLKLLVSKAATAPSWTGLSAVTITAGTSYTVTSNGYLLITPANSQTTATINSVSYVLKAGQTVTLPVFKDDVVTLSVSPSAVYLLPAAEVSVENL